MKQRYTTLCGVALATWLSVACGQNGKQPQYSVDQASAETGLPVAVIYAIALTESGRQPDGTLTIQPWPWTLNINGRGMFFETREAAARALHDAKMEGITNIDIGMMQINWRWNGDLVESAYDLLDPSVNLWAFTQVIRDCKSRVGMSSTEVIACYHAGPGNAGSEAGAQYVTRVADHLHRTRSLSK